MRERVHLYGNFPDVRSSIDIIFTRIYYIGDNNMFIKPSNEGERKSAKQKVFYFVWAFIHSIYHAAHRVIYQLFIPFVIHEEKFGTNNHHLILLGIQSSSLLSKKKVAAEKVRARNSVKCVGKQIASILER